MNPQAIVPRSQLVEHIGMPTNDEIEMTEAPLDVRVHAQHPGRARRTTRTVSEAVANPVDEFRHPDKSLPGLLPDGRLVLVRLNVDTPDRGYEHWLVLLGIAACSPQLHSAGDLLYPQAWAVDSLSNPPIVPVEDFVPRAAEPPDYVLT